MSAKTATGLMSNEEIAVLWKKFYGQGGRDNWVFARAIEQEARRRMREECAQLFDGFTYRHYEHPSVTIHALPVD